MGGGHLIEENADMDLAEASHILWRQRQLLEHLLFKLDVEQALLTTGRDRWLARATDEVERVLEELRTTELARAVAIDAVAGALGLGPGCSLRELAEAAPPPYDGLFADHRTAFLRLTAEVDLVARSNRELVRRAQQAADDVLGTVTAPGFSPADDRARAVLVDEVV